MSDREAKPNNREVKPEIVREAHDNLPSSPPPKNDLMRPNSKKPSSGQTSDKPKQSK